MYLRCEPHYAKKKIEKRKIKKGIFYKDPTFAPYTDLNEVLCDGLWKIEFVREDEEGNKLEERDVKEFWMKHAFADLYLGIVVDSKTGEQSVKLIDDMMKKEKKKFTAEICQLTFKLDRIKITESDTF